MNKTWNFKPEDKDFLNELTEVVELQKKYPLLSYSQLSEMVKSEFGTKLRELAYEPQEVWMGRLREAFGPHEIKNNVLPFRRK
jgi:hypothetical protein